MIIKMDIKTKIKLEKAVEVKIALMNMGISDEICPGLVDFSKILCKWVTEDEFVNNIA